MLSHAGLPHDCTLLGSTVVDPSLILKLMYLDGPLASLLITVTSHYGTMHIYVNTTQKLGSQLPGLENQVWWVKEFFYGPDRTLPTQLTIYQHGIMLFTRGIMLFTRGIMLFTRGISGLTHVLSTYCHKFKLKLNLLCISLGTTSL